MARTTGRKRLFARKLVDEVESMRSGYSFNEADYLNNPKEWSLSEWKIPFVTLTDELEHFDRYSETEKMDLLNCWSNFPVLFPFDLFDIRNWFVEYDSVTVVDDAYYGRPIGGRKMVRIGCHPGKFPWHRIRNEEVSQALLGEPYHTEEDDCKKSKVNHEVIELSDSD